MDEEDYREDIAIREAQMDRAEELEREVNEEEDF